MSARNSRPRVWELAYDLYIICILGCVGLLVSCVGLVVEAVTK